MDPSGTGLCPAPYAKRKSLDQRDDHQHSGQAAGDEIRSHTPFDDRECRLHFGVATDRRRRLLDQTTEWFGSDTEPNVSRQDPEPIAGIAPSALRLIPRADNSRSIPDGIPPPACCRPRVPLDYTWPDSTYRPWSYYERREASRTAMP